MGCVVIHVESAVHVLTSLKPVAWMPLDAIGEAYVDWVVSRDDLPPLVNVVHPRPTTWDVILKGLHEELGDGLSMTPLQDWVNKLEERSANPTAQDLQDIVRVYFLLSLFIS